jgi:hypothetical protein
MLSTPLSAKRYFAKMSLKCTFKDITRFRILTVMNEIKVDEIITSNT